MTQSRKRRGLFHAMGGLLVLAAALGGCREEEQGRILIFNKGDYAGKPDTPRSAEAVLAQRDRVRRQSGLGGIGHGSGESRAADVRPPSNAAGSTPAELLRLRGQKQNFN